MTDYVKAAEKYVAGHAPGDVHPDVAAAMHRFTTAQDRDAGDVAVLAFGRAVVDMVELVGDDYEPAAKPEPKPTPARKPHREPAGRSRPAAKKSTAKKAAGGRSRS